MSSHRLCSFGMSALKASSRVTISYSGKELQPHTRQVKTVGHLSRPPRLLCTWQLAHMPLLSNAPDANLRAPQLRLPVFHPRLQVELKLARAWPLWIVGERTSGACWPQHQPRRDLFKRRCGIACRVYSDTGHPGPCSRPESLSGETSSA